MQRIGAAPVGTGLACPSCAGPTSKAVSRRSATDIVLRGPVPDDRRLAIVACSDSGRGILSVLCPRLQERNDPPLSALASQGRQVLDDLSGRLEQRVASWMAEVELPKADHRNRHERNG